MSELQQALARKQAVRERVWRQLEEEGVSRFPGALGRIPNFAGAEAAVERLAASPAWPRASVIKVNPDAPQLPVRARVRADGKLLYMAVPRLASSRPFPWVNLVVTPLETILPGSARRPSGILWEHLDPEKVAECPC
jgi:5-formyltetrahydrofolate cyclo-ligase